MVCLAFDGDYENEDLSFPITISATSPSFSVDVFADLAGATGINVTEAVQVSSRNCFLVRI